MDLPLLWSLRLKCTYSPFTYLASTTMGFCYSCILFLIPTKLSALIIQLVAVSSPAGEFRSHIILLSVIHWGCCSLQALLQFKHVLSQSLLCVSVTRPNHIATILKAQLICLSENDVNFFSSDLAAELGIETPPPPKKKSHWGNFYHPRLCLIDKYFLLWTQREEWDKHYLKS